MRRSKRSFPLARLLFLGGAAYLLWRWRRPGPLLDYRDKVVLLTGGSRGLGLALARDLAGRGARLALVARDEAELERAAQSLSGPMPFEVISLAADLTVEAEVQRVVAETLAHYGRLDLLINDAGIIQVGPLERLSTADFEEALRVNFLAPLMLTQAARPHLKRTRGRIANIGSLGGVFPTPHLASYSASKFALVGFSAVSRAELARDGITVTIVNPGLMRTGSPRQAQVRGHAEAEYALFAALDQAPFVSLNAEEAARRILHGVARGDAELRVGGAAKLAALVYGLFPGLTLDLMALVVRLLPRGGSERQSGAQSETALTRALPGKAEAEARLNQKLGPKN